MRKNLNKERIPLNFRYAGKRYVHYAVMDGNIKELEHAIEKKHNIKLLCDNGCDVFDYLLFNEKRLDLFDYVDWTGERNFNWIRSCHGINEFEKILDILLKEWPEQIYQKKMFDFFYTIFSYASFKTESAIIPEYQKMIQKHSEILKKMRPVTIEDLNELPVIDCRCFSLLEAFICFANDDIKNKYFFEKIINCISSARYGDGIPTEGTRLFKENKMIVFLKNLLSNEKQFEVFMADMCEDTQWLNQQPKIIQSFLLTEKLKSKISEIPVSITNEKINKI